MKKTLIIITLLAILMTAVCSCIEIDEDYQEKGSASPDTNKSNLGGYSVVIESCRLAKDYEGAPIVIVKYKFTNNSEDPACFSWTFSDNVYQDGVGLNECYFAHDSANYSSDNQTKEIKKGASISVEVAYKLNDSTTDIEVEVSELISFDDSKVTKTFSIK